MKTSTKTRKWYFFSLKGISLLYSMWYDKRNPCWRILGGTAADNAWQQRLLESSNSSYCECVFYWGLSYDTASSATGGAAQCSNSIMHGVVVGNILCSPTTCTVSRGSPGQNWPSLFIYQVSSWFEWRCYWTSTPLQRKWLMSLQLPISRSDPCTPKTLVSLAGRVFSDLSCKDHQYHLSCSIHSLNT